jgi:uncharacterized protein YoxC
VAVRTTPEGEVADLPVDGLSLGGLLGGAVAWALSKLFDSNHKTIEELKKDVDALKKKDAAADERWKSVDEVRKDVKHLLRRFEEFLIAQSKKLEDTQS